MIPTAQFPWSPTRPGYTYFWSQDATLQGPTATGLPVGPYTVAVFDTTGCASLFDTVIAPPIVTPLGTLDVTDISCAGLNDGSITLTLNPGPYTFQWLDDPTITALTRNNLPPGQYVVLVSGGTCPSYLFSELGTPSISIGGSADGSYCPSDPPTLTADAYFGFQPDTYIWSTGDTTASFTVDVGTVGIVSVTAVDTSSGCTNTSDIFLTLLPSPSVTFATPDSLCLRVPGLAGVLLSNADSLVWRWGPMASAMRTSPPSPLMNLNGSPFRCKVSTLARLWQPAGIGQHLRASPLPAIFTAVQLPCTPSIDVKFSSLADSCAFFVGDSLVLGSCNGFFHVDLERYGEYDFTFYSTRPDQCDDTSTFHIDVRTAPTAFIPNSFTPNGDTFNDTWPGPLDIPELNYEVQIFDRWGAYIWGTTDTEEKWDGANMPLGVYVYTMHMRDPCNPKDEVSKNGTVTLFR
ncbi:MAG: gliding motility-associated C-terminal domain-containing protein [Flavobacteriales bacterium]|nr:gliding motility-associated C-terminal domain-containing protein [Flavobacteriales bacterium]